jgi:hypothetical protein
MLYSLIFFENNWGINVRDWILVQASAVALAAVAIIIIPLIMKKMWMALISTLLASAVGLFFINSPDTLQSIGTIIYQIVFK